MPSTFRLILLTGVGAGTEYPLEKTELQLGRDLSNDIVINDPEVSRRHAHLLLEGDGYILEDLGSTNGTFIRGQRLAAPVVLRPGETITIGEKVTLKYEVISADQSATVVVQRRSAEVVQPPMNQPVTPPMPQPDPIPPSSAVPSYQAMVPPQSPCPNCASSSWCTDSTTICTWNDTSTGEEKNQSPNDHSHSARDYRCLLRDTNNNS